MSSNVYHKQTNQHRTRRDRVLVIDGSSRKNSSAKKPETVAEEHTQKSIIIFVVFVLFVTIFLFLSIKTANFLGARKDERDKSTVTRPPVAEAEEAVKPAVLSTGVPTPVTVAPAITAAMTVTPISIATETPVTEELKDAEKIYRWGKVLEEAGEYDGALARYREALDVDPANIVVLSEIGRLSIKLGKYGEAVQALQSAIKVSDKNPDIMNDLGVALTFNGQPKDAVELYDRLINDFPDYPAARFNKGYALVQMHDYEKARPLLEGYLAKKPDDAMALGVMAVLELAEKQPERALSLLDRAIAASPSWSMPYLDAASICATMKQPDRALSYLERALEIGAPAEVYRQYQTEPFREIRITEAGIAFEKKIATRVRQIIQ